MLSRLRQFTKWLFRDGIVRVLFQVLLVIKDPWSLLFLRNDRPERMHELHTEFRTSGPVARGIFGHVVTEYGTTKQVLTSDAFQPPTVQMRLPRLGKLYDKLVDSDYVNPFEKPSMVVTEGADHARMRRHVSKKFTVQAIGNMREQVENTAHELIDSLRARDPRSPVDIMETYCRELPVRVTAEIVGIPPEDIYKIRDLGDQSVRILDIGRSRRDYRVVDDSARTLDEWVVDQIARVRRGEAEPRGLIGQIATTPEGEAELSVREQRALLSLLILAGFETTVNLLGNGINLLLSHPDQLEILRGDPLLWDNAVEEILRLDGPVLGTIRISTRPTEIAGLPVKKGMFVMLTGANHDPSVFSDPLEFDVTRVNAREHLNFGRGHHVCLGAALARMEGVLGLSALFDAFPDLSAGGGSVRSGGILLRGWESLPVLLGSHDRARLSA